MVVKKATLNSIVVLNTLYDFLPKVKIEIAISDEMVDAVIESITRVASTGKIGDGKIFVTNLEQVIRIRTGETGADAV